MENSEQNKCPRCGSEDNKHYPERPCPFDEDVKDVITYCGCCKDCQHQCMRDI